MQLLTKTANYTIFQIGQRELTLIPVLHDNKIPYEILEEIVQYSNKKRNVCYLFEVDQRLGVDDINKQITGDITSVMLLSLLRPSDCIKGWDIRQTYLSQTVQDYIYNDIGLLPLGYIWEKCIAPLNNVRITNVRNIALETFGLTTANGSFEWVLQNLKQNNNYNIHVDWRMIKLNDIFSNASTSHEIKRAVSDMIYHIRQSWANVSDLDLLEKVLQEKSMNFYIVMGYNHYNNIVEYLNRLNLVGGKRKQNKKRKSGVGGKSSKTTKEK